MPFEARARLFRRHDFKELFLARRGTHARYQISLFCRSGFSCLAHFAALVALMVLMAKALPERASRRNILRFLPEPGSTRLNGQATTTEDT